MSVYTYIFKLSVKAMYKSVIDTHTVTQNIRSKMAQTTQEIPVHTKELLSSVGISLDDLKEIKKRMTDMGMKGDIPGMLQKISELEQENG